MTEKLNLDKYHNVLSGDLNSVDVDKTAKFLEDLSLDDIDNYTKKQTKTFNYNGRDFKMLVDRPENGDPNKAVLVTPEFGTNLLPRLIAKSRVIRNMVDPEATLVIQPNSVVGEINMNFSKEERNQLHRGDLAPVIGRLALTMSAIGNPQEVTAVGISQGGMVALEYASDERSPESVSVAVVELPNIVERTTLELVRSFMGSGGDLKEVVRANFNNHEAPFAVLAERNTRKFPDITKFILKSLHSDNFAMISAMRHATADAAIGKVLNTGGSVVQVWGGVDNVSPDAINQSIANKYINYPRYESIKLDGMTHAIADFYAPIGVIAKRAHNISQGNVDS